GDVFRDRCEPVHGRLPTHVLCVSIPQNVPGARRPSRIRGCTPVGTTQARLALATMRCHPGHRAMPFLAEHLWTPQGWIDGATLHVDAGGALAVDPAPGVTAVRLGRFVVPGMPNIHSHAFQRAMA